jgi:hypothetical protein
MTGNRLSFDQLFAFVVESNGQMSDHELRRSFSSALDEEDLKTLISINRPYGLFYGASALAAVHLKRDEASGFSIHGLDDHVLVSFEYQRRNALQRAALGQAPEWLAANDEVLARWDAAMRLPHLRSFFLATAADHIVADIESFLHAFPSTCDTTDGCYVPLLIAAPDFAAKNETLKALPFMDAFDRDFIVDLQGASQ